MKVLENELSKYPSECKKYQKAFKNLSVLEDLVDPEVRKTAKQATARAKASSSKIGAKRKCTEEQSPDENAESSPPTVQRANKRTKIELSAPIKIDTSNDPRRGTKRKRLEDDLLIEISMLPSTALKRASKRKRIETSVANEAPALSSPNRQCIRTTKCAKLSKRLGAEDTAYTTPGIFVEETNQRKDGTEDATAIYSPKPKTSDNRAMSKLLHATIADQPKVFLRGGGDAAARRYSKRKRYTWTDKTHLDMGQAANGALECQNNDGLTQNQNLPGVRKTNTHKGHEKSKSSPDTKPADGQELIGHTLSEPLDSLPDPPQGWKEATFSKTSADRPATSRQPPASSARKQDTPSNQDQRGVSSAKTEGVSNSDIEEFKANFLQGCERVKAKKAQNKAETCRYSQLEPTNVDDALRLWLSAVARRKGKGKGMPKEDLGPIRPSLDLRRFNVGRWERIELENDLKNVPREQWSEWEVECLDSGYAAEPLTAEFGHEIAAKVTIDVSDPPYTLFCHGFILKRSYRASLLQQNSVGIISREIQDEGVRVGLTTHTRNIETILRPESGIVTRPNANTLNIPPSPPPPPPPRPAAAAGFKSIYRSDT